MGSRNTDTGFQVEPLGTMVAVGLVTARSARIWLRADRPGTYRIQWNRDGTESDESTLEFTVPDGNISDNTFTVDLQGLLPLMWYRYRLVDPSGNLKFGEGRFETFPDSPADTPRRFSIAVMSCNQPFHSDGSFTRTSRQMMRAIAKVLEHHEVKLVFMVGDQMYADAPKHLSLFDEQYFKRIAPPGRTSVFDCTDDEVRRLYQERYRYFWGLPGLQEIHANYPCFLVIDDHDIVDNWGSDPDHRTEKWASVGKGARLACLDYQTSRMLSPPGVLTEDFSFAGSYGHTAHFTLDLRSTRSAGDGGQLFSNRQKDRLKAFLADHAESKVLLLVLTVPVVHLPRPMAKLAMHVFPSGRDFDDRWSSGTHARDRDWFLKTLHDHQQAHPHQKVVLLCGDIHIGCVHRIAWDDGTTPFYQVISSPVTHETGLPIQLASKALIRMNRYAGTSDGSIGAAVRLVRPERQGNRHKNPYAKLNVGIIDVETPSPGEEPKLQFFLYGHQGDEPVCEYCSETV